MNENSVCYLAGAGEDISFDTLIAEKYHCNVFIFDPTPRAKKHYDELIDKISKDEKMVIPGTQSEIYTVSKENAKKLNV